MAYSKLPKSLPKFRESEKTTCEKFVSSAAEFPFRISCPVKFVLAAFSSYQEPLALVAFSVSALDPLNAASRTMYEWTVSCQSTSPANRMLPFNQRVPPDISGCAVFSPYSCHM